MRHEYKVSSSDYADIKAYVDGPKLHGCLLDIYERFRSKNNHSDEPGSWGEAYNILNDILSEYNIDLFE